MNVVILGGGYAAIWCYRALRRSAPRVRITVVAPVAEHAFHGFTGEVLDGELAPELLASPLVECMPEADRVLGRATAVDVERRVVLVEHDGATSAVEYDHLVVATGAEDQTDVVPGLAEHGWPLREPGRVEALLEHLAALAAEPAPSEAEALRRGTVVVVGAGVAGTEVAAALGRRYGSTRRVVLVSSVAAVVPLWSDSAGLQRGLRRNLEQAGVEVLLGHRVSAVDRRGVRLDDGTLIESSTVVATLGSTVRTIAGLERFQEPDGLIAVDDRLRVTDGVWAAGDVAAVRVDGTRIPKEALHAIKAGTAVGRGIARASRGGEPRTFRFRGFVRVAGFAPGRAVGTLYGVSVPEPLAWLARAAVFLWFVPSRRTATAIVRWAFSARTSVAPAPIAVVAPARPVLVPLPGGRVAAQGPRVAGAEGPRRAAGA